MYDLRHIRIHTYADYVNTGRKCFGVFLLLFSFVIHEKFRFMNDAAAIY